ncbi:hypothetical protein AAVH_23660 [Aphelenchoides avenae]|nr:hypothetical protein AAVH_23660 [Aphelenchus avenae]
MELALEHFDGAIEGIWQLNSKVLRGEAENLAPIFNTIGLEFPRQVNGMCAAEHFEKLVANADKRQTDSIDCVQEKFYDAFKRMTSLDTCEVNRASIGGLTDAQCRQALLLTCKMLQNVTEIHLLDMALASAFEHLFHHFGEQFSKLETYARSFAKETVDLLKKNDEQQKLTAKQRKRADEDIALAAKALKDSEALRRELEDLKASMRQEGGELA